MADDQDLAEADTAPVSMLERHPLRDADDQLRPDFVALISGAVQRDVRANVWRVVMGEGLVA